MKEQPAPLTPEEKYNLEGMTPEMREAAKEGLLPTVEEDLEMLELKATRELPWEEVKNISSENAPEKSTGKELFSNEILNLRNSELELISKFTELRTKNPDVVSWDFVRAYNSFENLEGVFKTMHVAALDNDKKREEIKRQFLEMMRIKLFLLNSEVDRIKNKPIG